MYNRDYKNENLSKIIHLAQNNDIKAIETLIRREQKHIFAIFSHLADKKEDVADLTQETLVKMAKNIGSLKESAHFRQWLNRIISNTFYDYMKKRQFETVGIEDEILESIKDKVNCEPGEKCIFSELENLVKNALMTLPINLRLSIVLREYEGLSYEEITKLTNTTVGTVKSRISRARFKLRELMSDFI